MTAVRARSMSAVLIAAACATALGMTPAFQSGVRAMMAEVGLVANDGWIMGGTGNAVPDSDYISNVEKYYLPSGYDYHALPTPEQFCPIICSPDQADLNFGDSVTAGVAQLDTYVTPELATGPVSVLGYSQSATVASVWMNELIADHQGDPDALNNLHVTLLGDPNNPVSGILDRFQFPDGVGGEMQHVPFLGIPMGLEPTPTSIPADIYIGEYDGWNNFPSDPLNLFAVGNALLGIETVHPYYPDPDPNVNLDIFPGGVGAIDLGTIDHTNFYAIPAPLPSLAFMYDGGPAGRFFYDSFNPFASLVNNWGYGNPGDPDAGVGVPGADPIGVAGPWQVDAYGQLALSDGAGFFDKMDPLQMLAGVEYAAAQTFIGPINDLLGDAGPSQLPTPFVDALLTPYELTNQLDVSLLTSWAELTASMPSLAPDAIFDGAPLISGQPLIDLVGYGFDAFNFFGA